MPLNLECIRDILLAIESCGFGEQLSIEELQLRLPAYSQDELCYTCIKLSEGGYLNIKTFSSLESPQVFVRYINDLTYSGHEFLNSIRENYNWEKVKSVAKKAGVFSLKAVVEIAQEVAKAAIRSALSAIL